MKKEKKNQRDSVDMDISNSYNPFMDSSGLQKPSDKAAYISLSSFLTGMAKSAHKNIVDPDKGVDFVWLFKKAMYAILTIGSVLLIATFIQYYYQ